MFQYRSAANYIASLGVEKPIHIGETGWATVSNSLYGSSGSHAADEYKQKVFYDHMRAWTNKAGMSCFYFEAFNEKWKDQHNQQGSENHFGMINLQSEAKYVWWDLVDQGVFDGLIRGGLPITKTYGGIADSLISEILAPPMESEVGSLTITTKNENREAGQLVIEKTFIIINESKFPDAFNSLTYPSAKLKLNAWDGTCAIGLSKKGIIEIKTASGGWWGGALEMSEGVGENLSSFKTGTLHFDIKGDTKSAFNIGFQSGSFGAGTQTNNFVTFSPTGKYTLAPEWKSYAIPVSEMDKGANFSDITSLIHFRGAGELDGKSIQIKNIFYTQN
jgi:hypothetical protein